MKKAIPQDGSRTYAMRCLVPMPSDFNALPAAHGSQRGSQHVLLPAGPKSMHQERPKHEDAGHPNGLQKEAERRAHARHAGYGIDRVHEIFQRDHSERSDHGQKRILRAANC